MDKKLDDKLFAIKSFQLAIDFLMTIFLIKKTIIIFNDIYLTNRTAAGIDFSYSLHINDPRLDLITKSLFSKIEGLQFSILYEFSLFLFFSLIIYFVQWIFISKYYDYLNIDNNFWGKFQHAFLRLYFNVLIIVFSILFSINSETYLHVSSNSNMTPSIFLISILLIGVFKEIFTFFLNTVDSFFTLKVKNRYSLKKQQMEVSISNTNC